MESTSACKSKATFSGKISLECHVGLHILRVPFTSHMEPCFCLWFIICLVLGLFDWPPQMVWAFWDGWQCPVVIVRVESHPRSLATKVLCWTNTFSTILPSAIVNFPHSLVRNSSSCSIRCLWKPIGGGGWCPGQGSQRYLHLTIEVDACCYRNSRVCGMKEEVII